MIVAKKTIFATVVAVHGDNIVANALYEERYCRQE